MLQWVNQVLRPHIFEASPPNVYLGQAPILCLDSFNVHFCGSVLRAIIDLGARVYQIPKDVLDFPNLLM